THLADERFVRVALQSAHFGGHAGGKGVGHDDPVLINHEQVGGDARFQVLVDGGLHDGGAAVDERVAAGGRQPLGDGAALAFVRLGQALLEGPGRHGGGGGGGQAEEHHHLQQGLGKEPGRHHGRYFSQFVRGTKRSASTSVM